MKTHILAGPKKISAWDIKEVASFDRNQRDILVQERLALPGIEYVLETASIHDFRSKITGES